MCELDWIFVSISTVLILFDCIVSRWLITDEPGNQSFPQLVRTILSTITIRTAYL